MKRLALFGLAAVLTWVSLGGAADPPAELSAETKVELLRTLAAYPKPVREAIMEIIGYPEFLKTLDPKTVDPANLTKVLAGQPEGLRNAVLVLAANPDVVELLQDDPDYYLAVAKEFARERAKIIALMEGVEKDDTKASEEWALRLEENQAALEELQKAAAAFAAVPNRNALDAGFTAAPNTQAVQVHTLPTPVFTRFVMANADKYPELSHTMVSQWLTSTNPASYDAFFRNWWAPRANYFHDSLLKYNPNRAQRLRELALFDRKNSGVELAKRYENFNQNGKDFPNLAKLPKLDPKRKPVATHQKPPHKDPHLAGQGPKRKPPTGAHTKAHRQHSPHHHIHHAKAGHRQHARAHHHGGKGKGKR